MAILETLEHLLRHAGVEKDFIGIVATGMGHRYQHRQASLGKAGEAEQARRACRIG